MKIMVVCGLGLESSFMGDYHFTTDNIIKAIKSLS